MFSVIMPVYNGENCIERAIESVLKQTFPDWELVVVNDGSTDNTEELLKKYADNSKIKIISTPNNGVSEARNIAMRNAKYDNFAFLDCDDIWYDNHLETFNEMILKYPDAGTYATLANIHLADGGTVSNIGYFDERSDKDKDFIYIENFMSEYERDKRAKTHVPTCACLTRAAAEKSGYFKKGCKIGEDLALFLLASVYYPVVLSRKITTVYEKAYSTATKDVSFDPDWYFFDEADSVLKDNDVPDDVKKSFKSVMQWFIIRRCRHYIIDGRKKDAWKAFSQIGNNKKLIKDKFYTLVLLFLPVKLVKAIFLSRWRSIG